MTSRITGTGSCLADVCVTNDWLSGIMDTSDEWIRTRTGIRERHLAKEMTTTDMAYEAAVQALSQAGVAAEDLDLIVVGTVTAACIMRRRRPVSWISSAEKRKRPEGRFLWSWPAESMTDRMPVPG